MATVVCEGRERTRGRGGLTGVDGERGCRGLLAAGGEEGEDARSGEEAVEEEDGDGAAFTGVGAEAGGRREEGASRRRRGAGGGAAPGKAPVSGRGAAQSPGSGGERPDPHRGSWGGEEGIVRGEWGIGWVARVPGRGYTGGGVGRVAWG
nr:glycine-rich protein 1-like [Aegilops tauschii subsp. strangulata]